MNPAPLAFPSDPAAWADWLGDTARSGLETARQLIAALTDGTERGALAVLELWNDADIALRAADSIAGLLAEVHPQATVRELAEAQSQEISKVQTERTQNRELFAVVNATDPTDLDADAARFRDRILRDFRRSGVDQSDEVRARLRDIAERLTVLDQDFSRNIREDVRSVRLTPERLAGLPADYVEAHPVDADGLVTITTDYPDVIPFRTFATDAAARRELTVEFLNRAWPANDPVLTEMLQLRREQAQLVGYESWPAYDADVKMVGGAKQIADFIEKITEAAESAGRRDYGELLARRQRDDPTATALDSADASYYGELIRRERFSVDAQQVRQYFDFGRVRAGLLEVTSRLFGIEYRELTDTPVWHEDVTGYDVLLDGQHLGRIYLDLHPREGKYKHAAQFDLVVGVTDRQLPEGVLVCNFPRGVMEHSDVVTLFHEFGHLVHHVLGGRQRWARFSGVATEWDFVEAPSQMLEEWAWDAEILGSFATNAAGEAIPAALVERMRAAHEFGKGYAVRTQMFYAAISYGLHADPPADNTAAVRAAQERYDLFRYVDGTHFHASFGHLAGYTSAYYTYMWSLVIAKDLFSAFDPADLFDETVAHRYRDRILARGGAADAADLVADFLGRPFSFDAYAEWLDRPAQ
ncbi:M3 family metallopeptidase [Jatrophihabitans sp.]|uniref:M3 family metallopeptidase n=1 Tax=Jatrophihabitans sp. TaxID=1932789 RepID=UPI0030C68969|nr:peptidase [Jatrophihabitans sp.]